MRAKPRLVALLLTLEKKGRLRVGLSSGLVDLTVMQNYQTRTRSFGAR